MSDSGAWPYSVLTSEKRTEQHNSEIAFLSEAHAQGHRAYSFGVGNCGAESRNGIVAELIVRGRSRWELLLSDSGVIKEREFFTDFDAASDRALLWLKNGAQ